MSDMMVDIYLYIYHLPLGYLYHKAGSWGHDKVTDLEILSIFFILGWV